MRKLAILLTIVYVFSFALPAIAAGDGWMDTISSAGDSIKSTANKALNALSGKEVKLYVNDVEIHPDAPPFIDRNNRTMVPLRFASEALGCNVDWDEKTRTVTVERGTTDISLVIGEKSARVNGNNLTLDTEAIIVDSRTMVPLRFIGESLQAQVEWVASEYAVYISDSGAPQPIKPVEKKVVEFKGEPYDIKDYHADYILPMLKEPGGEIKEVTVEELNNNPIKVGTIETGGYIIFHKIRITQDKIYLTQEVAGPGPHGAARIILAQGNNLSVERNSLTRYKEHVFTHAYFIDEGIGDLRSIEDVTHIMLLWGNDIVAVKNPLYK